VGCAGCFTDHRRTEAHVALIQAPTTVAELSNIYDVNGSSLKNSDLDLLKYIQSQPTGIGNTEIGPKAKIGATSAI
jgi:hypothetical protein